MMAEFRWIKMSLFLILMLCFSAAGQRFRSFTVRVKDDVTLSCENVIDDQNNCDSTTWLYSDSRSTRAAVLVSLGNIVEKSKSDRLSVTEKCALVIKKVTDEDAGWYGCRQFKSVKQQGEDAVVHLSVVSMNEDQDTDEVTLRCSVRTYEQCPHTLKWLFEEQDVAEDDRDMRTSQSPCYASVTFLTSLYIYTSRYMLFTCAVTDGDKVQVFPFRSQPSGEKPGVDTTMATTESTATENSIKAGTDDASPTDLWVYIIVAVALVALLILIVAIIIWRRTKGNKTQMNDTIGQTSNPAETQAAPEPSQDITDPEDGVSYASVSYTKNINSKAQVWSKYDDDDDDAVTYTTVKASSTDPNSLYATIK